jgi:hypothetical protein
MSDWAQLSRAQKWDLMRMAGASIVSTAFFILPLALSHPPAATPLASVATTGTSGVDVTVSNRAVHVPTTELQTRRPLLRRDLARRSGTQPDAPSLRVGVEPESRVQRNGLAASASAPLHRKLARFIAGNGRYSVRPFPTVALGGS